MLPIEADVPELLARIGAVVGTSELQQSMVIRHRLLFITSFMLASTQSR